MNVAQLKKKQDKQTTNTIRIEPTVQKKVEVQQKPQINTTLGKRKRMFT